MFVMQWSLCTEESTTSIFILLDELPFSPSPSRDTNPPPRLNIRIPRVSASNHALTLVAFEGHATTAVPGIQTRANQSQSSQTTSRRHTQHPSSFTRFEGQVTGTQITVAHEATLPNWMTVRILIVEADMVALRGGNDNMT